MALFAFAPKLPPFFGSPVLEDVSPRSFDTESHLNAPDGADVGSSDSKPCATSAAGHGISSLADVAQGLPQAVHQLRDAIDVLPEGQRKNQIEKQAISAIERVLAADLAGKEVQRIDRAIASLPDAVPAQKLVALHKQLDEALCDISSAVDTLAKLDAAIESHCADFPGNGGVLRAAIATVVFAGLALALILACPPVGLAVAGVMTLGGLVGVASLLTEYSERVDRRTDCWTASQEVLTHLATIAEKACALMTWEPKAMQGESVALTSLAPPLPPPATYLEKALEKRLGCGDTEASRTQWRRKAREQFANDFHRHLAGTLYPYILDGKRLVPPTAMVRDKNGEVSADHRQALQESAIARMRAATGNDEDLFDVLTLLFSQGPINALEEVCKAALAHAGNHPEEGGATTLNGDKLHRVRIDCDSHGRPTGGSLFYQESQPSGASGIGRLKLCAPNGRDIIELDNDAALVAEARFTIDGRRIRIDSVSMSASTSVLEAYANS